MDETDPTRPPVPERAWWKEAVVYQIYPRSFNDSDGDGIGDIPGIVEKVDYLADLGVGCVWLCPVYDSPNHDNGYDIRDYRAIMDEFGTMADWEELLAELHARDVRLIMDLVVNHTSSEHEWFRKSRRREDGHEDYYYWRDGDPDEPPNNWKSIFGGPAWTYDETREQWYLHLFDETQPDLNWETPDVREDIKGMIRWWLEKGIDGFRMDAINFLSKAEGLPDGDPTREFVGSEHYSHGPRIHEFLGEIHGEVVSDYDAVTAGEMGMTTVERAADYLGRGDEGLDMVFQFKHLEVDRASDGAWDPDEEGEWGLADLKAIVTRCQHELAAEGWDAVFVGNHDLPRVVSRFGDEAYREESAKLIATFLLTLRGTPFVYQGDEIGTTNAEFESPDELDDPMMTGLSRDLLADGRLASEAEAVAFVNHRSRDHARTPMQWSDAAHAGFTDGEPWFRVNENYPEVNVERALGDEDSVWHYYRRTIDLRHREDALVYGAYDLLLPDDDRIYAYTRTLDGETLLVVLNWSAAPAAFEAPTVGTADAELLIADYDDTPPDPAGHEFRPYEAAVYRL
ncbi:glucohydrolase [Halobacteriales archaeon QS_5_70_15]|nr:MAG: glucohydrolase [Halobacteriales archaeon QS_5_70_15]